MFLFQRVFQLSNGNKLIFTRNPPFGLWSMNYAKGGMPQGLQGMFTSFQRAYNRIESYLGNKGIIIEEEEPWLEKQET